MLVEFQWQMNTIAIGTPDQINRQKQHSSAHHIRHIHHMIQMEIKTNK